jgi:pyruvate formate lyase activating enzyme
LKHLEKRRALLSGAVLSGGEPTLYGELPALIRRVKGLGLSVKLDTNGMEPVMLERLLQSPETSPDYIALDLKAAPERYVFLGSRRESPENALKTSAALVCGSGIPHEFRTLSFPNGFITEQDIEALAPLADDAPWYFRPFRPGNCLDPAWDNLEPAGSASAEALARKAVSLGKRGICPAGYKLPHA